MGKSSNPAPSSYGALNYFIVLVASQVTCACFLAVIANAFNIRFLGDVCLLLWTIFSVVFVVVIKCRVVLGVILSVLASFASLLMFLFLHCVYRSII